jgi:HK97 gp10 family phage protein
MINQAKVEINTKEFELELAAFINENAGKIAKQIEADAQSTTAFKDKTGNLRESIKSKKSRYDDGGWIVQVTAPHAHLLEFGTEKMAARAFLRPALDRNIQAAKMAFGVK